MKRLVKDGGIRDGPIVSIAFVTNSNFLRKKCRGVIFYGIYGHSYHFSLLRLFSVKCSVVVFFFCSFSSLLHF